MYSEDQKVASKRYSNIKSRVKKSEKNLFGYDLENYWKKDDFISWYEEKEKKCCYCNSTQVEIEIFYNNNSSKRKKTRGRVLEIERFEDKPYSRNNCDLVCYWCNNAKSDVFSPKQFQDIGIAIGRKIKEAIAN